MLNEAAIADSMAMVVGRVLALLVVAAVAALHVVQDLVLLAAKVAVLRLAEVAVVVLALEVGADQRHQMERKNHRSVLALILVVREAEAVQEVVEEKWHSMCCFEFAV
ncbi:hypothetical protein TELCIR_08278 [Teladorsagia circumcincta]|uniref:Uncharacterized protein n=1 Tax=Teladorsagia circumcincta TaxID=45464 RepID=A0A2G9UI10_TELCI|nr:hypothetical protein TELCIR_08278 [Teladorsagia circumcincta]